MLPLPVSLPTIRLLALLLGALLLHPGDGGAQTAVLRGADNVRADPGGTIIGQLYDGSRVRVEGTDGNWTRITLEGVVWIPSLQARDFGTFDLVVSEEGGENLREEPGGRIAGRLGEGTLLQEVSRQPGWARVRRTAWIWTPSLEMQAERDEVPTGGPGEPPREDAPPPPAPDPAPPAPREPAPGIQPPSPPSPPASGEDWIRIAPPGPGILSAPDGDTLALARKGTELRVLSRDGNWARVRVEGWVWLPGNVAEAGEGADEATVLRNVDPGDLSRDPDAYRGRVVELELQFISLERAERIRSDFREGEPFLLTRSAEAGRGFVYVALPPEGLGEVERLTPLTRIQVVGRVRTGSAALTGSPILDLLELRLPR